MLSGSRFCLFLLCSLSSHFKRNPLRRGSAFRITMNLFLSNKGKRMEEIDIAKVKLYHGKQIGRVGGRLFKCYLTITMLGRGMQRLTKKRKYMSCLCTESSRASALIADTHRNSHTHSDNTDELNGHVIQTTLKRVIWKQTNN